MKLLVLDGNSIVNRAFYGIKPLTTKDGRFTQGIYGFINILGSLNSSYRPDAVAIAFDLKAPTFRHKMYDGYKGNRKGMPEELAQQMPVLKELLVAMGYRIVECEGWEADDILGTLSAKCTGNDMCYIATGDRDSLQLVNENVHIILASTKMGQTQHIEYDIAKIKEDKGVEPLQLIDVKALMGDSSDNIPGVAGIGEKTATELISKYDNIDYIYENIDALDIKEGVRTKLINGKESAYLSRTLGTISKEAPVDTDLASYIPENMDRQKTKEILTSLEFFKFIDKFGLNDVKVSVKQEELKKFAYYENSDIENIKNLIKKNGKIYFVCNENYAKIGITTDNKVYVYNFDDFIDILTDEKIEKYTYNYKSLCYECEKRKIKIINVKFDCLLAGYILNPDSSDYSVKILADNYGVTAEIENAVDNDFALTAVLNSLLCDKLYKELENNKQTELLTQIEIPLSRVLSSMEYEGFFADKNGIVAFGEMLDEKIRNLIKSIYEYAGCEFNINSPKQLGEVLFEKLDLPAKKKTKTGYSTNAEVLEDLRNYHPIISDILEYRTLAKLKSTYCDGLIKVIEKDGRIHSTFQQTETRTGRLSSTEPNLQNIPVRSELGKEMRKFFLAENDNILIDADYSQIELRVLAHISNDKNMIEGFNSGDDIHSITASQVFNMPLIMVTPMMRSRAKAVNFGIVYGIGAFSLGKDIGVSRAEADKYIKSYLSHYNGVDNYMKNIIESAKTNGYVTTLFGRRRYLPELTATNHIQRAFGERVARNTPIQGTAADIIKIAMVRVFNRLESENMKSKLIMQVHDELIIEAPINEKEKATKILKEEMENAIKMKVKLIADAHSGKTWYEAKS